MEELYNYITENRIKYVAMYKRILGTEEKSSDIAMYTVHVSNSKVYFYDYFEKQEQANWDAEIFTKEYKQICGIVVDRRENVWRNNMSMWYDICFVDGRLTRINQEDYFECGIVGKEYTLEKPSIYVNNMPDYIDRRDYMSTYHFWMRALKLCAGMTEEEIGEYVRTNPESFKVVRTYFDPEEQIISIDKPVVYRSTDNNNKNTFDYVRVQIIVKAKENLRQYVKDNLQELSERALVKINSDKGYTKYGVPTEFLRLYSAGVKGTGLITLNYQLKSI